MQGSKVYLVVLSEFYESVDLLRMLENNVLVVYKMVYYRFMKQNVVLTSRIASILKLVLVFVWLLPPWTKELNEYRFAI